MILTRIEKTNVPVLAWTKNLEHEAIEQAVAVANYLPVNDHVALMPDSHTGYGIPVGGVVPLEDAISPYCVGVDIGCGMSAIKTMFKEIEMEDLKKVFSYIRAKIPVGTGGKNDTPNNWPDCHIMPINDGGIVKDEVNNAKKQLGTLGSGNHFIECQQDQDGNIWFMVHSGSRNLGLKVANYYHSLAVDKGVVPNGIKNLAYFDRKKTPELFDEYVSAMNYALNFAYWNRAWMIDEIINSMMMVLDKVLIDSAINIHHNYAEETQYGILHRKGATSARKGELGIIPGSMGTKSYIVEGLGNPESFESCSHGAGRVMSRSKAKATITKERYLESLRDAGLEANERDLHIDEAPDAYKDIDEVMENQSDLVKIVHTLKPYKLPAIKG